MARFVKVDDDYFINVDNIITASKDVTMNLDKGKPCYLIRITDIKSDNRVEMFWDCDKRDEVFNQIVYGVKNLITKRELSERLRKSRDEGLNKRIEITK